MPSKILVPVDGSENAKRALDQAISIAKGSNASITIVNVAEKPPTVYVESQKILNEISRMSREQASKVLDEYDALAESRGVKADSVIIEGEPAASIIAYAEKGGFDMIVMGSRGLGKFKELLLGSVSGKVVSGARCSVLIVK
ncbi:universal stress protein [Nitrososphaera sp.]|uniref:universal stress protein n=1 Tax=Nitrososphaera sp. TaxID=1971748 RepID=UPI00307F897B